MHDLGGAVFQLLQDDDFGLQFGDGLGGGGLVHHLVGQGFVFVGAEFVGSVVQVVGHIELALDDVFTQVFAQHVGPRLQLQFFQPGFELLAPARQRDVDGLRAGGQAALQLRQGKADVALAFAVEPVGAVHFIANVVGDLVVEQDLGVGQGVVHRVGAALGEQRPAVKAQ